MSNYKLSLGFGSFVAGMSFIVIVTFAIKEAFDDSGYGAFAPPVLSPATVKLLLPEEQTVYCSSSNGTPVIYTDITKKQFIHLYGISILEKIGVTHLLLMYHGEKTDDPTGYSCYPTCD